MKGLVIGKFYPPHLGHSYLIETALKNCDSLDVLVCDSEEYAINAVLRSHWLQQIHPEAKVQTIKDIGDDDNSKAWADHTIQHLGYSPDIVFTSEDYGETYAKYLGARHHQVDKARTHVPICATAVRKDFIKKWQYLTPTVKADLALRVVVVGAESTGTTTLAKNLAEALQAPWVPEYGRLYSEALQFAKKEWKHEDFVTIAKTQQQIEKQLAKVSNGLIICDTNATATQLWEKRYMGEVSSNVEKIAQKDKVDLYIITGDEIPFVQDGTRDGQHIRHDMNSEFQQLIKESGVDYILANGTPEERLKNSLQKVKNMIQYNKEIKKC